MSSCIITNEERILLENIKFPKEYVENSFDDLKNIVENSAEKIKVKDNVKLKFLVNYKCDILGLYIIPQDTLNICKHFTDYFTLNKRVKAYRHDSESYIDYWRQNKKKVIDTALIQYIKYKDTLPSNTTILRGIEHECAMALYRIGIPMPWPICLAMKIIKDYKATNVLDMSAGWGDRLIASCLCNVKYQGYDPNISLQKSYNNIIQLLSSDKKNHSVIPLPFEEMTESDAIYDLFLTSPPFFNLEHYSNNENQSDLRYKTIEKWVKYFLKPSLKKASQLVKKGGHLIIHMSDVIDFKFGNNIIFTVDILNWLSDLDNLKFLGVKGYAISQDRKTETAEELEEKNINRLKERTIIKQFDNDGVRIDKSGKYLSQPLWIFKKI